MQYLNLPSQISTDEGLKLAYQGIIPTLASFMHHDAKNIRKAILIGSFIPLIAYVIWQWLILGIVPLEGPNGLKDALQQGQNAVHPLKYFIYNGAVYWLGQAFAFFALAVGGFLQGGGFGSFSKKYGIAAASLLEAEIVIANGEVLIANEFQNADLF